MIVLLPIKYRTLLMKLYCNTNHFTDVIQIDIQWKGCLGLVISLWLMIEKNKQLLTDLMMILPRYLLCLMMFPLAMIPFHWFDLKYHPHPVVKGMKITNVTLYKEKTMRLRFGLYVLMN